MPGSPSFVELAARLRQGEDDAAAEVFELYASRLIDLARTRLHNRLRRKLDPEDVLQSALKSFFSGVSAGKISLSDWDGLWTILVVITLRKCSKQVIYYGRARRAIGREVHLRAGDKEWRLAVAAIAREPQPDEVAQFVETLEQALRGFNDIDRLVLLQTLQGIKPAQISMALAITKRRVYRVLERVRARLLRLRDAD
jgi:DNA-directed RNA polymerase specialized sigma24 family protein